MVNLLMLAVRDTDSATTLRQITAWRVRDPGNVSRIIQVGKVRDTGNVLRVFYSSVRVTVAPPGGVSNQYGGWPYPVTVPTASITATPTGGTPPYTYAWNQVSGPAGITAVAPTAASTSFQATFTGSGILDTIWRSTVTDANGGIATADFRVYIAAVP